MDRIRFRDLQRWSAEDIEKVLPVVVTRDSQAMMVLLTLRGYKELVEKGASSHDSQANIPIWRKGVDYKAGSMVRYKGEVMVVPETDMEGNVIDE